MPVTDKDMADAKGLWGEMSDHLRDCVLKLQVDEPGVITYVLGGMFAEWCGQMKEDPVEQLCRLMALKRRHSVLAELEKKR